MVARFTLHEFMNITRNYELLLKAVTSEDEMRKIQVEEETVQPYLATLSLCCHPVSFTGITTEMKTDLPQSDLDRNSLSPKDMINSWMV